MLILQVATLAYTKKLAEMLELLDHWGLLGSQQIADNSPQEPVIPIISRGSFSAHRRYRYSAQKKVTLSPRQCQNSRKRGIWGGTLL